MTSRPLSQCLTAPEFEGQLIQLPWARWRGVKVYPYGIVIADMNIPTEIDPQQLRLLLWKAAFYDRGLRGQFSTQQAESAFFAAKPIGAEDGRHVSRS